MPHPLAYPAVRQFGLALLTTLAAATAHAAAPFSTVTTPGFARVMVGAVEVTALSDGTADLPMVDLLNQDKAKTRAALAEAHLGTPTTTSVNAYLVNTGSKLVLIDSGAGALFGPTLGKVLANLRASGYQPEQVDDVLITHLHPDHAGGLISDGKLAFPNATVHADQREADFWLDDSNIPRLPKSSAGFFQGAQVSLKPYIAAGKFAPIHGDGEVVPGIQASASYGHTAGHVVYVVESEGKKMVVLGDLIHVAAVQFPTPQVTIGFDSDAAQAAKARQQVFARVAREGALVAGAHLQFPGLGYLSAQGKGWRWVAANYTVRP